MNAATTPQDDFEASENDLKSVAYTGLTVVGTAVMLLMGLIYFII